VDISDETKQEMQDGQVDDPTPLVGVDQTHIALKVPVSCVNKFISCF
jgi:hypothetical protein